ncbi:MAG: bifunctional diguanylate cyclase/phosphodiesterase [Rhodobacteraceae bacterium]|nr:bifunctional diguanylate cyclase/phosphodiesterase [Paracoccaceae bacterium]
MPRSATAEAARAHVRRWIDRREVAALLPALLLAGLWLGGEPVLVAATVLVPALMLFAGPAPGRPAGARAGDGLTGLATRADLTGALDAAFAEAGRSGRTTAVFALAIDDLAEIEARHGIHAAEEVQRRTAGRIAAVVRRDDVVARIGPGLFAVAFAPVLRVDHDSAVRTAERLQAAVRAPVALGHTRLHVTGSVGFCLAPRAPRPSGEAALAAALDALGEAQDAGPGSIRAFTAARPRPAADAAAAAAEAVAALEQGRIRPWFQPQVAAATGAVTGFEALARWEHPERGVLTPKDFLPALAAAGQSERLGEVMLYHTLSALRAWDRAGLAIPSVGVNFSAEELRNPRLAEKLAWELDRFDLAPDRLTVEILETVMAEAGDDSIAGTIAALAALGCRIDLDDFGTGNASIAALRRFKVSRIKIDRSFVINLDEDRDQQLMVAAILGLAGRLGLDTLAEGVERVGEHAVLAELGCGHVQGFAIARPMPFEETIAWLERHAARRAAAPDPARRAV